MKRNTFRNLIAAALAVAATAPHAWADLASGYSGQYIPVTPDGQFTAYAGQVHYWTASSGYNIYNVAAGTTTTIGKPPGGTQSNGYGDAFGAYDPLNNLFYAATVYNGSDSMAYTYNRNTHTWVTPGPNGVSMVNSYSGQVHNGQLYFGGLAQPWNGGYGQDNYIFAYDHSATPNGAAPRHDTLIQTSGNSANLAVAPNGDVYYGTYSDNTLYRWTAAQVASVTDNLFSPGAVDHFLTLTDAAQSWSLPGGGNGLAVDAGGHVFFAVNNLSLSTCTLGEMDSSQPSGYRVIDTVDNSDFSHWYGSISVDGDLQSGGTLYFSDTFGGSLLAISEVPEPTTSALFALGGAGALVVLRRRSRK